MVFLGKIPRVAFLKAIKKGVVKTTPRIYTFDLFTLFSVLPHYMPNLLPSKFRADLTCHHTLRH